MIRILIADDHGIVRKGLKQIVAEHPNLAVTGAAAVADVDSIFTLVGHDVRSHGESTLVKSLPNGFQHRRSPICHAAGPSAHEHSSSTAIDGGDGHFLQFVKFLR